MNNEHILKEYLPDESLHLGREEGALNHHLAADLHSAITKRGKE